MRTDRFLTLLLLLCAAVESNSTSPPGKPVLLGCRSPEKETFTCWWKPGSDGGLPTTLRLFYERERLEGAYECPDYLSAGRNSCFFNKTHTSIWVDYYLTVVASNALGNATSDTFKMDVMDIVKPNAPENVTLLVEETEDSPHLHIRWEHPRNTDTRSGWVTLKYEVRVKQDNNKWKEYTSGIQTHFSLYSITPGMVYTVQVRCSLDHGSWSEWSNTTHVKAPSYFQNKRPSWILVPIMSAIPFIGAMCILVMKRKHVKKCVLPPVPGPKIRGVDFQLLKKGRSEDAINALITSQNFPLMVGWKDQMEDFLIVTENDIGLLPDASSCPKRKRSLIIPAGFRLDSEIQHKESTHIQNDWAGETKNDADNFTKSDKSLSGESLYDTEVSHKQQRLGLNFINTDATELSRSNHEDTVRSFTDGGYVDILRHAANKQEDEVTQADYSRVQDVNSGDALILEGRKFTFNSSGYMKVHRQEEKITEDYSRVKEVNGDNVILLQRQTVSADNPCGEKANTDKDSALQKPTCPHVTEPHKAGVCTELINTGYVEAIPAPSLM